MRAVRHNLYRVRVKLPVCDGLRSIIENRGDIVFGLNMCGDRRGIGAQDSAFLDIALENLRGGRR